MRGRWTHKKAFNNDPSGVHRVAPNPIVGGCNWLFVVRSATCCGLLVLWGGRNCQVCVVDANFCSFKRYYLEQYFYTHYFTKLLITLTTARKRWLGFRRTVGFPSSSFAGVYTCAICAYLEPQNLQRAAAACAGQWATGQSPTGTSPANGSDISAA